MIHVAHHGDDRGARFERQIVMLFGIHQIGVRVVQFGGLGDMPHFFHDDHRGFLIEYLVDGHHGSHVHQHLDDLGSLDRHLLGQFRDRNGLRNCDFAHDRLGRQREGMFGFGGGMLDVFVMTRRAHRGCPDTGLLSGFERCALSMPFFIPGTVLGFGF